METPTDGVAAARAYYRALDDHDYDLLSALLAAGFVHERPDRTIEGRERFVRFMREDRPQKDTSHDVEAIYRQDVDTRADGGDWADGGDPADGAEVAVRGHLRDASGDLIARFVDVFTFEGAEIARIRTFTN